MTVSGFAPKRLARLAPLVAALLVVLRSWACTTESVVGVTVSEIGVEPGDTIVTRNDSLRLSAVVRDEQGAVLDGAHVAWSSDRPSIVSVSPSGVVSALRVGPATVTATLGDVEGSARITVVSDGTLEADPAQVEFQAAVVGRRPDEVTVEVRDAGGGSLQGLDVEIDYADGTDREWLDVNERRRPDHVDLELEADARGLLPGTYEAAVLVSVPASQQDPLVVPVTLTVAGILVVESGGETVVGPASQPDRLEVALELQPETGVVLDVASSDPDVGVSPARLAFGSQDWDRRQTVTVAPVGPARGAPREVEVRIEVDRGESDRRFHALDPVRVPVRVAGRPAGITVRETDGSTVAREGRSPDLLYVSLDSRPESRVLLDVGVDDRRDARVSPTSIAIEPGGWDERVTVAFRAVDDREDDGDRTRRIVFTVDRRTDDAAYRDLDPVRVEARTIDDDGGGRGGGGGGDDDDSSGPGGGGDDDSSGPGGGRGGGGDDNSGPGGGRGGGD